jgi:hypothetical protein
MRSSASLPGALEAARVQQRLVRECDQRRLPGGDMREVGVAALAQRVPEQDRVLGGVGDVLYPVRQRGQARHRGLSPGSAACPITQIQVLRRRKDGPHGPWWIHRSHHKGVPA